MGKTYYLGSRIGASVAEFIPANYSLIIRSPGSCDVNITLSFSESKLLEALVASPGETFPRDILLKTCWEGRVVSPGSLSQCVFGLRNYLSDTHGHDVIQTVPRRGYRYNIDSILHSREAHLSPASDVSEALKTISAIDGAPEGVPAVEEKAACASDQVGIAACVVEPSARNEKSDNDRRPLRLLDIFQSRLISGCLLTLIVFIALFSIGEFKTLFPGLMTTPLRYEALVFGSATIYVVASPYATREVREKLVHLQFPVTNNVYTVWIYPRRVDLTLSCVNAREGAINASIPWGTDWQSFLISVIERCINEN